MPKLARPFTRSLFLGTFAAMLTFGAAQAQAASPVALQRDVANIDGLRHDVRHDKYNDRSRDKHHRWRDSRKDRQHAHRHRDWREHKRQDWKSRDYHPGFQRHGWNRRAWNHGNYWVAPNWNHGKPPMHRSR